MTLSTSVYSAVKWAILELTQILELSGALRDRSYKMCIGTGPGTQEVVKHVGFYTVVLLFEIPNPKCML